MQTIQLKSWEELQKKFEFPSDSEKFRRVVLEGKPYNILFRGQANADWLLKTTLQRLEDEITFDFMFTQYCQKVLNICGAVDTYTGSKWNFDNSDISFERFGDLTGANPQTLKTRKKFMEYLIYLRHCGFPSPLLDWSESPYVAAFFAFTEIPKEAEKVAIYQYQYEDIPVSPKDNRPVIHSIAYNFNTHKRHYLQQTQHTICIKNCGVQGVINEGFGKYEEAVLDSREVLVKYIIPSSERKKVLRQLDKMNITFVSLFETEEALVKTLALREMELWKD